ncbi:MAG: prolipoprotein diacylglyceryl transferase [Verrucomicrobiota bacterium]|nr:prolipoprotein diacylglyceryl transferase [Verrucomicrobiota bacterium]
MHSEAFTIFGLTIYWYGILAATAFMVAFWSAGRRASREGIPAEAIMNLAPWIIIGAIIGARLLYVLSYWKEEFAGKPLYEVIMIRRSGLVFYGGLIGSSLATILYCYLKRFALWKIGDIMAPSVALGHFFGRIGCLMTGCCYGRPTDLPWAIHFPKEHWTHGVGVHPTQFYDSLLYLLLFFGLMWLYNRKKFDGQIFAAYLIGYACLRAIVESFRGDYDRYFIAGLTTPGQAISIGIMATGLVLWWMLSRIKSSSRPAVA